MNSIKAIVYSLIIQQIIFPITHQLSFRPKYFRVQRAVSCPVAPSYGGKLETISIKQPIKYQFQVDADIRFVKNISDPIQFQLKYTKCSLDSQGSDCDNREVWRVDNVCDRFTNKNSIWSPLFEIIEPKLFCPIKEGIYKIRNGTFDLSMISRLPVDGFRYLTTLSLFELVKDAKEPLQLLCFDSDVTVTLSSSGRPRYKGKL